MEKTAIKGKTATSEEREWVDSTLVKIEKLEAAGQLHLPKNYSAANALRSAWLAIQDVKNIDKRPALEVCTKSSICNAMLDTVIQGLNPGKNQVYYIVYGDKLQATRSYLGTMTVAKRQEEFLDIEADVVRKGDTFQISKSHGNWVIEKHESAFENIDSEIIGAYCIITRKDGSQYTDVMTIKQIQTSWSKAKTNKVQQDFPDQMAKRTVINRACKYFICTSDDSDLVMESFVQSGDYFENSSIPTLGTKDNNGLAELNAELARDVPSKLSDTSKVVDIPVEEIKSCEEKEEEVTPDDNGQIRVD